MIGIKKKRFINAMESILLDELRKGNMPTSNEFKTRLTRYLEQNDLSKPEYKFKSIRNGEVAESYKVNEIVEKIQHDLQTLYENTIAIHDELKGKFDWFETEKNKIEYESRLLENELKEKILTYGKTGFLTSVFDVFDDISKVEVQENIIVDVEKHEVTLKDEENTSFILNAPGDIYFQSPLNIDKLIKKVKLSGSPNKLLTSYENDFWQEIWLTKEEMPVSGYFDYPFKNKQKINRIELNIQTVKSVNILIEFTPDDTNWFHLPYYENGLEVLQGIASFDFPTIEAKGLRIWIKKNEHDGEIIHSEGYRFQYVFGAKSIKLYQLRYPEEGVFISKSLTPEYNGPFSIGKVSLITEEEKPPGTDIKYYVAVNEEEPLWREISPVNDNNPKSPQLIDFKYISNSQANEIGIPENINVMDYESTELESNGIAFYRIGTLKDVEVINNTERLFLGKNAWMVKESLSDKKEGHIPSIEDWQKTESEKKYLVNMDNARPSMILKNKKHDVYTQYHFSLGFFCEEKEKIISSNPSSTEEMSIFLNGELLFRGLPSSNTQVNYRMKNGWNNLVVLIHVRNINSSNGTTVDIGFHPNSFSNNVYSNSVPMEKVTLFDLRYNIKNNDWNKYALYEKDDVIYVITNHAFPGVKYDMFYDYIDKNSKDSIQLKAVLSQYGDSSYTTPKIKRYTLQFS